MENEITELRNQVRTLKRIVYGFGCLLVAGIVVGATSLQTVPDVIQAKKFEVVNDEGKVLVELRNQKNQGMLVTRDYAGHTLVEISVNRRGLGVVQASKFQASTFQVRNDEGKLVAAIVDGVGGGLLRIYNDNESRGVELRVFRNAGELSIYNKDRKKVFEVRVGESGGYIATYDNRGPPHLTP